MSDSQSAIARVEKQFETSAEQVFDAWLDPVMLGKWMFGPAVRDEAILSLTVDAQVGGRFSFLVRRQGQEIDHVGEYLEIDRPCRLVFTWATADSLPETSRVGIEIVAEGNGCRLTLAHEMSPKWADFVDRITVSWQKMVDSLGVALRSA